MESLENLVSNWLNVDEAATAMQVSPNRIRQWIKERELIGIPDGNDQRIPSDCIDDGVIVKNLGGTLTLLADSGFSRSEADVWMFIDDESLPGRPIDALRENRGREVRRRAQALAL